MLHFDAVHTKPHYMEDECDSCWWLPNDRCLSLSKPTPPPRHPRPAPPPRVSRGGRRPRGGAFLTVLSAHFVKFWACWWLKNYSNNTQEDFGLCWLAGISFPEFFSSRPWTRPPVCSVRPALQCYSWVVVLLVYQADLLWIHYYTLTSFLHFISVDCNINPTVPVM